MTDESIRPWGHYEVLYDGDECKVKRIVVKPQQRLSYQKHYKRAEHWTIVSGEAIMTLDGIEHHLKAGDHIHIPLEAFHRIQNPHATADLIFVEVQTGTYFGEDDIVRVSDEYGRDS